jgi:hypothetical protein
MHSSHMPCKPSCENLSMNPTASYRLPSSALHMGINGNFGAERSSPPPVMIRDGKDARGGLPPASDISATATTGANSVGSDQSAIKVRAASGANLTHEELEAFGFAPRRESQLGFRSVDSEWGCQFSHGVFYRKQACTFPHQKLNISCEHHLTRAY